MRKSLLFTIIFFCSALLCPAQDLVEVKETNTVPGGNGYPSNLTTCNGKLFFTANDNIGFASLWVTEGTDATSLQLRAPIPGLNSDRMLVSYKNKIYFMGDDGINGPEVWVSDGTVAGTVLFKDVYPGSNGSFPQSFTVGNNKLFFFTYDIEGLKKLFVTDGTVAGTILLKTGIQDFNGYTSFAILNNDIYFIGDNGMGAGFALWKSDGTPGGTALVNNTVSPG